MANIYTYKTEPLENEKRVVDFSIGVRLFYVVSVVWILQKFLYLDEIFHRNPDILIPTHWFGHLLLPLHLPQIFFQTASFLAIGICVYLFFIKKQIVFRLILLLILMSLNTLKMSLGYIEQVDHLFLLAHFFLISYNSKNLNSLYVKYFQAGLLFTYSAAGFYKLISLPFKYFFTNELTWLNLKSLYYQTFVIHEEILYKHMPQWMNWFLNLGILPVILMLLAILLQTMAIACVPYYKTLKYYLLWLIIFHLFNYVFFDIIFPYAAITAICFLFPFSIFTKKV